MSQFRIESAVYERAAGLTVGLITAKNIKNSHSSAEVVERLRKTEAEVRSRFASVEDVKNHPNIRAWQEIHRSFGSNPNKFPPSILALLKRVVQGKDLPTINALVDLYNIISMQYVLPAGGEDLDRCRGDIRLGIANGDEHFKPLGGNEEEPPTLGEIIYRDDEGAICRKFNWREAERTCLNDKTTNAILVLEAVPPVTREALQEALDELQTLVLKHCGGEASIRLLDASKNFESL